MPPNACRSAKDELAPKVSLRAPADVGLAIAAGLLQPAADVGLGPPLPVAGGGDGRFSLEAGLADVAAKARSVASFILRSRSA